MRFAAVALLLATSVASAKAPSACVLPAVDDDKAWWADAFFYEVFVRSFQDSDGDGIGDLNGLISRLDYLNDGDPKTTDDLGVTALWLMPISRSPSYHGYDVVDYKAIASDYGTMEDFERLVAEAGKRGIRVVLDLVMNHTSRRHPWFVKGKRGKGHPFHDYYVWSDGPKSWGQPWNDGATTWHQVGPRYFYGLFWDGMPDLNYHHPPVLREFLDIAAFWTKKGAAGFRLDAVRYLVENGPGKKQADQPETHAALRRLRAHLDQKAPEHWLIGEVWTDMPVAASYTGKGDELHSIFDFDLASALRSVVEGTEAERVRDAVCAQWAEAAKRSPRGPAPFGTFVTNHDMKRLPTPGTDPRGLRLSASLLATLPGVPFVYYGEELALPNGPGNRDEEKRLPMRWDDSAHRGFSTTDAWRTDTADPAAASVASQSATPDSMLSHYRRLIQLRGATPALRRGSAMVLASHAQGGSVIAFARQYRGDTVVVLANVSSQPATDVAVDLAPLGKAVGSLQTLALEPTAGRRVKAQWKEPRLPPFGAMILRAAK